MWRPVQNSFQLANKHFGLMGKSQIRQICYLDLYTDPKNIFYRFIDFFFHISKDKIKKAKVVRCRLRSISHCIRSMFTLWTLYPKPDQVGFSFYKQQPFMYLRLSILTWQPPTSIPRTKERYLETKSFRTWAAGANGMYWDSSKPPAVLIIRIFFLTLIMCQNVLSFCRLKLKRCELKWQLNE